MNLPECLMWFWRDMHREALGKNDGDDSRHEHQNNLYPPRENEKIGILPLSNLGFARMPLREHASLIRHSQTLTYRQNAIYGVIWQNINWSLNQNCCNQFCFVRLVLCLISASWLTFSVSSLASRAAHGGRSAGLMPWPACHSRPCPLVFCLQLQQHRRWAPGLDPVATAIRQLHQWQPSICQDPDWADEERSWELAGIAAGLSSDSVRMQRWDSFGLGVK